MCFIYHYLYLIWVKELKINFPDCLFVLFYLNVFLVLYFTYFINFFFAFLWKLHTLPALDMHHQKCLYEETDCLIAVYCKIYLDNKWQIDAQKWQLWCFTVEKVQHSKHCNMNMSYSQVLWV